MIRNILLGYNASRGADVALSQAESRGWRLTREFS
jgi:hypothetical protein